MQRSLDDGTQWSALSADERADVIDSYRLVYRADSMVNWCPGLGTVLANEEVTSDGRSERGNFPVFRKRLRQWMMRITAYSDRLLDDLDVLDWPDKVKTMQRNWIGRSTGASVLFRVGDVDIEVFTTRPDTLFGATYLVLAPEHPLVEQLTAADWPDAIDPRWTFGAATPAEAVAAYRRSIAAKSDLERQESKSKTGVFLGAYATNPADGQQIPIFIADYVLAGYGTGAIMAVPGHDQRDWEFAHEFGLPIVEVIAGGDISQSAYTGDGEVVNSGYLDGLSVASAKEAITARLVADGRGQARIEYKLRDWLFARQRYWGEPFPIVYDAEGRAHPLPESALPVELPDIPDYAPVQFDPDDADSEPSPPLGKATDWVNVELDLGDGFKHYTRDTNVMPQWAGSSWYELRYTDPYNKEELCAKENEAYWMGPRPAEHGPKDPGGVDLYVGGVEHAVLHLLYARFWHKVLYDLGHISSKEPYRRLVNQGYIQAFAYTDSRGAYVPAAEVSERDGKFYWTSPDGEIEVFQEFGKIGKSLKNSVSPDEICDDYGADTLRVYEMSMGPLDASRPWATKDVVGAYRFLQRVWRLVVDEQTGTERVADHEAMDDETLRLLHRTIAGVSEDYAALRNNTAAAKLIEYTNHLTKQGVTARAALEPLVLMVAPLAPHLAEELWRRLGHQTVAGARAVPGGRPAVPGRGHGRVSGAGQRQGPRPRDCGCRRRRGHARGRGACRREGQSIPQRRHPEEGHRRGRQARQHRRLAVDDVHLDQDPSQQLAGGVAGQLVDEHHIAWHLVPGQVVLDVKLDLLGVLLRAGLENNEGTQPLSEVNVVDTDHGGVGDILTLDKQVLDLLREHVLTAGDDHVVVAAVDEQQPVFVEVAHIAAGHVAVDDLLAAAVGVPLETRRAANEDPAPPVGAVDAPVVLVEQGHFGCHRRATGRSRSASQFGRRGDGGESALGGGVDVVEDIAEGVLHPVGQLGGQR